MVKLRKFVCYRHLERPHTRKSKYRKKSFVRGAPVCKIVKFHTGNLTSEFSHRLDLSVTVDLQIRDNALESARLTCNRTMEKAIGKNNFRIHVRVYPHHVLREHALAAGAGADRFSSGMAHSFGKPIGNACRLKAGQKIISIHVNEQNLDLARTALKKANHKLPCNCRISITKQ